MGVSLSIVSTFTRRLLGGLPRCVKDIAIAWWKDFNTFISSTTTIASGVLDFDGMDDYVSFASVPDVTGSKTISFKMYIPTSEDIYNYISFNSGDDNDFFLVGVELAETLNLWCDTNDLTSPTGEAAITLDNSLFDSEINVEITKTTGQVTGIKINGTTQSFSTSAGLNNYTTTQGSIGRYTEAASYQLWGTGVYFYDININDEHAYSGYPNGNTDTAWEDTIGSVDGVVNGSPTTVDISDTTQYVEDKIGTRVDTIYYGQYLDSGSGQINLYRSAGTYDYVDPSDGSSVTGNAIPANGLITVPANGISEITTSDGSRYPVCERAGTVLHDVLENSKHISVATPNWSETLYGSDSLNQCGFVDKELSDQQGLAWETEVNGSAVALADDTLIPIALWSYQDLLDSNGEEVLDSSGETIQVKVND